MVRLFGIVLLTAVVSLNLAVADGTINTSFEKQYEFIKKYPDILFSENCLFKNGKKLDCGFQTFVKFLEPINLKDFNILPVSEQCEGSSCLEGTVLIIESKGKITINRQFNSVCLECGSFEIKNYEKNQVDFVFQGDDKYRSLGHFDNGKISVNRVLTQNFILSDKMSKPNLKQSECDYLYEEFLNSCAALPANTCSVSVDNIRKNRDDLRYLKVNNNNFRYAELLQYCIQACRTRKTVDRIEYNKQICGRE
jgi:hypothetical protein